MHRMKLLPAPGLLSLLSMISGAAEEEGGGGRCFPGAAATLIDLPPTDPGLPMQAL